ncbi:MAG TPA: DUF5723 family protein [Chitinophagaceae bacterium]|nr:DUF5723 family protein [Chitinophagaceae bacterium]
MKKSFKHILLASVSGLCISANAQEMAGFRADNYNGVNGAFFNPANLAGGPYKVDVNIFGGNFYGGNKNKSFTGLFSDLNSDTGSLNNIVGPGTSNSILLNVALHLPSVSYSINEKATVAFLARTRVLFDIRDFDGDLINSITNQASTSNGYPFTINNNTNMRINANVFSEFGLSGSYVVYNEGNHFIKAGGTLKYLAGVSNVYFQMNKLNTTIDADGSGTNAYATNSSGSIALGAGGADFDNNVSFGFNASGFGADVGAVYEYRPDDLQDETIPYFFKANVAILDIGGIKYNSLPQYTAGYDINILAGQKFYLDAFNGASITETKAVFDKNPQYFTRTAGLNSGSYRVALPRTLQIGGDVRAMDKFYVAANLQLAMVNNETKPYNPNSLTSIMLTPRFESRMFSAYLPFSYNNLTKMNLGIGLRAGPFYAGSSGILSGIFGKAKQLDMYLGFRVGFRYKKEESE